MPSMRMYSARRAASFGVTTRGGLLSSSRLRAFVRVFFSSCFCTRGSMFARSRRLSADLLSSSASLAREATLRGVMEKPYSPSDRSWATSLLVRPRSRASRIRVSASPCAWTAFCRPWQTPCTTSRADDRVRRTCRQSSGVPRPSFVHLPRWFPAVCVADVALVADHARYLTHASAKSVSE